jgi:tetratricopeptide (TPR) repeat protein
MKLAFRFLVFSLTGYACLWAQKGTTTPPTTGTTTTSGSSSTSSLSSTPKVLPTPTTPTSQPAKPIYFSGQVVMDDGSSLPSNVDIESVCNNRKRIVGHTTSEGYFGVQFNDTSSIFEDASENGRPSGGSGSTLSGSGGTLMLDPLAGCELSVNLAGYSSSRVGLDGRTGLGDSNIGLIILHRLTGDEGRVVSLLSLKAPKDARKDFDKGNQQFRANKPEDAAASFRKALAVYPQYPDAWLTLGIVQSKLGAREEARTDFQKAMDLDQKLVGPWQELGFLSAADAKWDDTARYLGQAVKLDPTGSPRAWYFSAVANYNLGKLEIAEHDARAAINLDHGRGNSRAQFVLGMVLIAKKDLPGGADALRTYIASGPGPLELETAKKQLERVQSQLGR